MKPLRELFVDTETDKISTTKIYAFIYVLFNLVIEIYLVYKGLAGTELVYANFVFISGLLGLKGVLRVYGAKYGHKEEAA